MRESELTALIAERIRSKRADIGLSQEELGAICGLHRTYIGALERGEKRVTVITLAKIAHALEASLPSFLE